jgi:16S rRNA (adenine1518-N6/adenine1519-N6)-dimethyltransferase
MGPVSRLASPTATRAVLDRFGHGPRHSLGQNFLVNDHVIAKIVDLAELDEKDVVLEVGPGIGTLTVALCERACHVVSIEADRDLPEVLAYTLADEDNFTLVEGDATRVAPGEVASALAASGVEVAPDKFVANLPYQVAATLILQYFETYPSLSCAVVMVQKEVADRIAAAPGSKTYGAYTVKLRLWAETAARFEVGPSNFMPAPRVDSAVVKLVRRDLGLSPAEKNDVARVVEAAFAQRRKTIRNSMGASGWEKDELDVAFAEAGIDPKSRAERLDLEDFIRLTKALVWRG